MSSSWSQILFFVGLALVCSCSATTVDYDSNAIIINGQRKIILSGSIHYTRSTAEMWPDLIQKAKDGGLDAVESYIFWNAHEPRRREYNFYGNLDFVKFFKLVQQAGMYGILRIGPYVCAEWNYGGFPVWLHNIPGIEMRTDNEIFKQEMLTFTTLIVNMCKQAGLFASQGGPIILAQIENEYGNVMWGYGDAGKAYIKWCAQMAVSQNIGVPWIMCQQDDAPPPMISTCNGFYCDSWKPKNPKLPKIWTENWSGWFTKWGQKDPHRTASDLAFSVARFFQAGGVVQNYYMYHGGTNFGRTSGGPFVTTSYDYDAPLDEYGNLNQPKWGHLKQLHAALKQGEKILTSSTGVNKNITSGVELTTYTNAAGERFCFLSNTNMDDAHVDLQHDGKHLVPAWSVSILQNCSVEIYNTAKVNTQATVMEMKKYDDGLFSKLLWVWTPEPMIDTLLFGRGSFVETRLLEQKHVTYDSSDYLWYMTNVNIDDKSFINANLSVNFTGQVLYAYVNGQLMGNQSGYTFTFNQPVSLHPGRNLLTLLSVTVGLQNYGVRFDLGPEGIAGGPVKLIGSGNKTLDLSSHPWSYKVGLNGEAQRLYDPYSPFRFAWKPFALPVGRPMTWYKTIFKAPRGEDPVVVDLLGMGKGEAWVNGNSLGRYWPAKTAGSGCSPTCNYRGKYNSDKCLSNCNNPTQRWYHVPRSFLNSYGPLNTLILFEEIGGNPANVSIQIVTAKTVCGHAYEGTTLELSCQGGGRVISDIQFASVADHQGACGSFHKDSVEDTDALSAVEKACVGKESCSITASKEIQGMSKLGVGTNRLTVQAVCSAGNRIENGKN